LVSERTGCPEQLIDLYILDPRTRLLGLGTGSDRSALTWTPRVYRATGCGRTTIINCPEWDSYDQKPNCRLESD
jgi:hypothetical protein